MAASASHSQADAPPGAALACLPLAPHFTLVPGALGKFIHQTRRQWLAPCLSGKRERQKGMALSPDSHPPDQPGTQSCPQRVGKAERGGQLTPPTSTPTWPLEPLAPSPPTLEFHIRVASKLSTVATKGHIRMLEIPLPFLLQNLSSLLPRCLSAP